MRPWLIVLHYTAMDTVAAAVERMCDPARAVSAHYLIAQDGSIIQMVEEDHRAWHAGVGSWAGCDDVNSASIGIELCNLGTHPFPAAQIDVLKGVLGNLMARWQIPPEGVIGHSDMAPGRKSDPGPLLPWRDLADEGVSIWPPDPLPSAQQPLDVQRFCAQARGFGYTADVAPDVLLQAVRDRFRPNAKGRFDGADAALGEWFSSWTV